MPDGAMLADPGGLIVWRRGFGSYLRQVDRIEYEALQELGRSGSFAALCAMLVEQLGEGDGVARAANLLAQWLTNGLIVMSEHEGPPKLPESGTWSTSAPTKLGVV